MQDMMRRVGELAGAAPVVLWVQPGDDGLARELAAGLGSVPSPLAVRPIRHEAGVVLGAVTGDGRVHVDHAAGILGIPDDEVARRAEALGEERVEPAPLRGATVVIVGSAIHLGPVLEAAVRSVRARGAARVVVVVPRAPVEATDRLQNVADHVVCGRRLRRLHDEIGHGGLPLAAGG